MRVYLDFINKHSEQQINEDAKEVCKKAVTILALHGWEEVTSASQIDNIVERMAQQLPDEDVDVFVENVLFCMTRHSPRAWLTIDSFMNAGVPRIRLRMLAHENGSLAPLGRNVANIILENNRNYELQEMLLWEQRKPQPILLGEMVTPKRLPFGKAARANPQFLFPLLFAIVTILVGGYVSYNSETKILGDNLWGWYCRVFAPLVVTTVTTTSAIVSAQGSRLRSRVAEWIIPDK